MSKQRTRKAGRSTGTVRRTEAPGMVTTTIALDEETHRQLRHLAIEERTSLRELIRAAIAAYLARPRGGGRAS